MARSRVMLTGLKQRDEGAQTQYTTASEARFLKSP
jgi:hypothetical protein